jgi:nitrogen-specific signal transduction histidine kinase
MSRARWLGGGENETRSCASRPNEPSDAPIDVRQFAHSIRNPLNGARLHLVFLERELGLLGASRDAIESARVIGEEIDRIAGLLAELCAARRPAPRPRTLLSLNSLCAGAVELVSSRAREAGVDVGAELAEPDSMLAVHRQEMEQVLFDLLHRALQSALASGSKVLLRARRDAESGQAVIEIRHEGDGATAALGSTLEPDSGSDFRVAMRIVADHGGSIDVDSRPGHACFHIELPIVRGEPLAPVAEWSRP